MKQNKLPAYPLFVKDPNYSIWSASDELNGDNPQAWWGESKKIYGFMKVAGKTYCFMGNGAEFKNCGVINAKQTSLNVTAFTTDYTFETAEAKLNLRFVSPLPLNDLELLSMPVCYLEYEVESNSEVEISLFVNRNIAYNDRPTNTNKSVRGGVVALNGLEVSFLGLKRQLPLSNNDDMTGADWGYFHLSGEEAFILDDRDLSAYLAGGITEFSNAQEERYIGSVNRAKKGTIALGYDDTVAIDYYGNFRKTYYLEKHTIFEGMEYVHNHTAEIDRKLEAFEQTMKEDAKEFGEDYLTILNASLRQSIAAHKLVTDEEGNILFLSKENGSNGCIATVDVSYPSMPLYLLYAPELVKGMMRPILKFAQMPVWKYDFAPHDAGTYPACCGQVYGLSGARNKYLGNLVEFDWPKTHFPYYLLPSSVDLFRYEAQMPVEECANLLIMFLACYRADGDNRFFTENAHLCEKWVEYLVKNGLKPENQLCTDDFAGHLANNLNLAMKAIVGIQAYAELEKAIGKEDVFKKYSAIAKDYANEIVKFGEGKTHLPITWDTDEATFSLKYNLAFDKIFGLNLFPQSLLDREIECYLQKSEKYGVPLDSRADYTKSDWICWAATLTDDVEKQKKLVAPIAAFLAESPDRVPFCDWYDTKNSKYYWFRARSVQGGCFILLLKKAFKNK